jgi:exodeoxyribonuclease VII large subunit
MLYDLSHRLDDLESQADRAIRRRLARETDRMKAIAGRLESLSPLGVLARGYSLTTRAADGKLVRTSSDVLPDDMIQTRLAFGSIVSRVERS